MKRLFISLLFLGCGVCAQTKVSQDSYELAVTVNYHWGLGIHLNMPLSDDWTTRASFEASRRPERDRFSPQVYSLALAGDATYQFGDALELSLPADLSFYIGTGATVSYNIPTFIYRSFFAVRAGPFIGIAYDFKPKVFLELGPEIDFTPHFNVSGVDITPKARLGVIIVEF